MSDFSESYHLRGSSRRDAVALLERAGLSGYVFPALDGWVSFVAEGKPFVANQELISANSGILLRWIFAEDHGWSFEIYKSTKRVINYECHWDEEFSVKTPVDYRAIRKEIGIEAITLDAAGRRRILEPTTLDELIEVQSPYAFATAIGLTHFKSLSYEYLLESHEENQALPPGVLHLE